MYGLSKKYNHLGSKTLLYLYSSYIDKYEKGSTGFNTSATSISLVSSCYYSIKHQKEKVVRMYDAKIFFPQGYPPDQAQHPYKQVLHKKDVIGKQCMLFMHFAL